MTDRPQRVSTTNFRDKTGEYMTAVTVEQQTLVLTRHRQDQAYLVPVSQYRKMLRLIKERQGET